MTHISLLKPERYEWDDCEVLRYGSNNGVVLKHVPPGRPQLSDVLCFIDGDNLGVDQSTDPEIAKDRARPIFKEIIKTHNRTVEAAMKKGRNQTKAAFQEWLKPEREGF